MRPYSQQFLPLVISWVAVILALPFPYGWAQLAIALPLITALVLSGSWFARKSGLFSLAKDNSIQIQSILKSVGAGLLLGVFLLLILRYGISQLEPKILERLDRDAAVPLWKWSIILFHAPVLEEVIFRLFSLSLIAFLILKFRNRKGKWQP